MHAIAYGFLAKILACMAGLTVRLLSRTIRPCRFQQGLAVDCDAYDYLSHNHFFAFDCMVTYSAMHGRVLFVPFLPAIHAGQLYSCQVSSRWDTDTTLYQCDVSVVVRHCSNVAVAGGPCNHWRLTCSARSTLITVGIIHPHHAGVNTFF